MKTPVCLLIVLLLATLPALAGLSSNSKEGRAVESAGQLMAAGQPEKARGTLIRALADSPDNPYLLYNIALTHYAQKDYQKAQEILLQVEGMDTQKPLRALVLAQMGNIAAHIAKAVYDKNPGESIDHLRRAHQLFASAIKADPSQSIATTNDPVARDGLVGLILDRAGRQIEVARQSKNLSDRIEKLMATQRDIDEVIELAPGSDTAASLKIKTRNGLISALVEMGDVHVGKAEGVLGKSKNERGLHEALDAVRTATNAYRDALLLQPDSTLIKEKLQKANALSAQILVALGVNELKDAETANFKKKTEQLEKALHNFNEASEVNPDDATARRLQEETNKALADLYEKTADNLVAKAESLNRPAAEEQLRSEAHDNYTEAERHAPEDAELKARRDENARALAKLLDKTGTEKLDQGIALTQSEPEKAVATLESASSDLSRAAQLMQEHGLNADATEKAKAEAEAAMNQLNQNPSEAARKSADLAQQAAQSAGQSSKQAEQAAAKAEAEKSSAAQQAPQSQQKAGADKAASAAQQAQKAAEQSAQSAQQASEAARSAQTAAEQAAQAQRAGKSEQAASAAKQAEQQAQNALAAASQAAQSANQAGGQPPTPLQAAQESAQAASKAAQQAGAAAQAAQSAAQQKNAQSANQAAQQANAAAQQAQSSARQAAQQSPQSPSASAAAQSAQQAEQSANTAQAAARQAMLNQLTQSSASALKALGEARNQSTAMSVGNGEAERSAGSPPSYQSMAHVLNGEDFNNKKGGGSSEGEANFNTQSMKKPARDW